MNTVQRELAIPVDAVRTTYIRIRSGRLELAAARPALTRAAETLSDLERRIRALRPPADARALHRRLVTLDGGQAAFAADIALLSRYLPALVLQERRLGLAGARLSRELRGSTDPVAQRRAFAVFSDSVAGVAARIDGLVAPTDLEAARVAEVERTQRLVGLSRQIGDAIEQGDAARVGALLDTFGAVAQSGSGGIERGAVIAFNRRARRITDLQIAVERERARLDRALA